MDMDAPAFLRLWQAMEKLGRIIDGQPIRAKPFVASKLAKIYKELAADARGELDWRTVRVQSLICTAQELEAWGSSLPELAEKAAAELKGLAKALTDEAGKDTA
jgi:hypothetical protein